METPEKVKKLIDMFCSNAKGVLETITNQSLEVENLGLQNFEFDTIKEDIEIPGILESINFSKDENFQTHMFFSKDIVATLSDLMMLGDGDVEYNAEEHNDALQEMTNQILGSLTSELSGEGVSLNGTVSQVELTDMEIQQEFMSDNKMSRISINLLDKEHFVYFILDPDAEEAIGRLFEETEAEEAPTQQDSAAQPGPQQSTQTSSGQTAQQQSTSATAQEQWQQAQQAQQQTQKQEKPVDVSRAQFGDIAQSIGKSGNVNIDMLLDVVLPVSVELGKKNMKIKQVLELGQGSVVELNKTAGEPVDLLINGKKFAVGEVMVADENYAVRIISLVSRKDRIKSLGEENN